MRRFYHGNSGSLKKPLISILIFAGIVAVFYFGVNALSRESAEKQMESLENAIRQGITHCYATEGHYPESLGYLQEHYGIRYDSDKYFVDYQILGENILPDVTIIEKQEDSHGK